MEVKIRTAILLVVLIIVCLLIIAPTLASIGSAAVATGYRLPYIEKNNRTVTQDFDTRNHRAYDFGMKNDPVVAAKFGQVVAAVYDWGPGGCDFNKYQGRANYVIVLHPDDGLYSFYGHLRRESKPIVKVGQLVSAGDLIGYAGNSGYYLTSAEGCPKDRGYHLHFMVQETPKYFDSKTSRKVDFIEVTDPKNVSSTTSQNFPRVALYENVYHEYASYLGGRKELWGDIFNFQGMFYDPPFNDHSLNDTVSSILLPKYIGIRLYKHDQSISANPSAYFTSHDLDLRDDFFDQNGGIINDNASSLLFVACVQPGSLQAIKVNNCPVTPPPDPSETGHDGYIPPSPPPGIWTVKFWNNELNCAPKVGH